MSYKDNNKDKKFGNEEFGSPKKGEKGVKREGFEPSNGGKRGSKRDNPKGGRRDGDGGSCKTKLVVGLPDTNHPKWYTANKELVDATTRIPIHPFAGKPIKLYSAQGDKKMDYTVPGVMRLEYVPIPGTSNSSTDAINIAAQNIFQTMRKKLSTVANYAPADVMMMVLAIDGVFMQIANLVRLYGLLNVWNTDNWYLPYDMIIAGYNMTRDEVQDLMNRQAEFRTRLNMAIYKASTLYAPMDFNIIARHQWLASNIFTDDGANARAQYYIPTIMSVPILDETSVETGTSLLYNQISTFNWEELLDVLNTSIEAIRNSDSFTFIMSDMRRAYEGSGNVELAYVPENYHATALVDPYFKEQLHNATLAGSYRKAKISGTNKIPGMAKPNTELFTAPLRVYQSVDANTIICEPHINFEAANASADYSPLDLLSGDKFLNLYTNNFDTDTLCEATRSMIVAKPDPSWTNSTAYKTARIESAGGDILVNMSVFIHNDNAAPTQFDITQISGVPQAPTTMEAMVNQMSVSLPFDYSPMLYYKEGDGKKLYPLTEVDYYTVVPESTLKLMNEAILTSMWDLPTVVEKNMK